MSAPVLTIDEIAASRWERFLGVVAASEVDGRAASAAQEWDDDHRVPSSAMLRCLLTGQAVPPAWRLIRTPDLWRDVIDDVLLARWIDDGLLDEITTIRFKSKVLSARSLVRVCEALPRLRRVELRHMALPADALLHAATGSTIRQWALFGYSSRDVSTLLASELTAGIDSLSVATPASEDSEWWESTRMQRLGELRLLSSALGRDAMNALVGALPRTIGSLAVIDHRRRDALEPLLAASLPSLTRLDLSHSHVADEVVEGAVLLHSGLEQLDLSHNPLGDGAIARVAAQLVSVTRLNLGATRIGRRTLEALPSTSVVALGLLGTRASGRALTAMLRRCGAGLQTLVLQRAGIDAELVEALGTEVALPRLSYLDVSFNDIDGDAFVHLTTSADLPRLEMLRLTGCPLGVSVVVAPRTLPGLRELYVDDCRLHLPDASMVFDSTVLPRLEVLRACAHELGPETASILGDYARDVGLLDLGAASSRYWGEDEIRALLPACAPTLVRAQLGGNPVARGAVVEALSTLPWPRLAHLDVHDIPLSPDDIRALAASSGLNQLVSLWISCPSLAHLAALAASPLLGRLESLMVYGMDASDGEPVLCESQLYPPYLDVIFI